jgi:hypothetical protein
MVSAGHPTGRTIDSMFATLLGALPRPPLDSHGEPIVIGAVDDPDADVLDDLVRAVIRAQEVAGFEPITDGRLRDPSFERVSAALSDEAGSAPPSPGRGGVVDVWKMAAGATDRAVKQALPGPYSLGHRLAGDSRQDRERHTLAASEALAEIVAVLAGAGCPLVEIEETEAHRIGDEPWERQLFREAHRRLLRAELPVHLSLSIVGGSAAEAGVDTILDAPYASLAVDLIAGPDNWNLVTRAPGERGVIVGVQSDRSADEPLELMLWAAHYAAGSSDRGGVRIGLGSAGSWANLAWQAAARKMAALGEAARLAAMPPGEDLARSLDPRAVSIRRAALGHDAPRRPGTPD